MKGEAKEILLDGRVMPYILKRNSKARRMSIQIFDETGFVLTKPRWASMVAVEEFIHKHSQWINRKISEHQAVGTSVGRGTRQDYLAYKLTTKQLIEQRLKHFNQFYGFKYNKVSIRDQQSRWGSCTMKNNLNFNYRILFLPSEIADYIVVHELCHLKEHNHGVRFWALVGQAVPDFRELRQQLRKHMVAVL